MTNRIYFASDRRVHTLLSCSAAVLLSACGAGTPEPGSELPASIAAQSVHSDLNASAAPVGADMTAATPAAEPDAAAVMQANGETKLLATSVTGASVTPLAWPASPPCNYYIAPTGSDSGAGTIASPWKTIRFGSAKLTAGKTLCARGGTYYGQAGAIWKSSGTAKAPVTFRNYPGERPVFDGQWGDTGTHGDFLVFTNNRNVVVDGITAQRYADKYGNGTIDLHNGQGPVDNITIQRSTFIDNGSHPNQDHHIYLATGASNVTIRNNFFIRAAGSAIQSYHSPASSGIRIYNNVMIGGTLNCAQSRSNPCPSNMTQHWGLIIGDAKATQIYNNTIYGMQYGIDFNYGTTTTGPFVVKNNLIVNSTVAGIRVGTAYAPHFTSDYNGFYGNRHDINWKGSNMSALQFASATSNERHAVRGNPLFVNPAASDFRLHAGSPVIDKAAPMTLFNYDKVGVARPNGYGTDIGAYEWR